MGPLSKWYFACGSTHVGESGEISTHIYAFLTLLLIDMQLLASKGWEGNVS